MNGKSMIKEWFYLMINSKWKRYTGVVIFNKKPRAQWMPTGYAYDRNFTRDRVSAVIEGEDVESEVADEDAVYSKLRASGTTDSAFVDISGQCIYFSPQISDGLDGGVFGMMLTEPEKDYVDLADWCRKYKVSDLETLIRGMLAMWIRDFAMAQSDPRSRAKLSKVFPVNKLEGYINAANLLPGDVIFDRRGGKSIHNARAIMNCISWNRRR